MHYTVRSSEVPPAPEPNWQDPIWSRAETLELAHFRPESSAHRPRTLARLLYTAEGIHGIFQVDDRYVPCRRTHYFDEVWKDGCVEFFAQPKPTRGYFNLEFSCAGGYLCSYITNPERTPTGFKEFVKLPASIGRTIRVRSSLLHRTEPEITEPVVWVLSFFVPFAVFESYVGTLGALSGQVWRGNLHKCADESSHPHWGSWSPLDQLNFHRPSCFAPIRFE